MKPNLAYAPVLPIIPEDTLDLVKSGGIVSTDTAPRGPETGERALMRAVLQDAILCLRGHAAAVSRSERQRTAEQAFCWIASRDTTWLYSFETICDVLGLDAHALRQRLLADQPLAISAPATRGRAVWHEGGMVSALRAVRMRGNQRKGTLRLRERRRRGASPATRRGRAAVEPHAMVAS